MPFRTLSYFLTESLKTLLKSKSLDETSTNASVLVGIFNDLTGALFSRIYPMVARKGGHIYVYSDLRETFSYTEFALDMRSQTVQYECEYTPSFDSLIKTEQELSMKECDVIIIHGVLDYLPDDVSYRLFKKLVYYWTSFVNIFYNYFWFIDFYVFRI